MKVEGVGMGVTLIHRDAIRIMLEKMPELVDERLDLHPARDMIQATGARRMIRCFEKLDIPERGLVSEDLSFCIRWQQCGGETWANINHRISHVGPYDYSGRYLDAIEQQMAAEAQQEAAQVAVDPIFTIQPDPDAEKNKELMILDHAKEAAIQALLPSDMVEDPKKANGSDDKPKKRRGRPAGAKNKKTKEKAIQAAA